MPLTMPKHHQPDLSDKHCYTLALENEIGRRVNVYVWRKAIARHALDAGYEEPYIYENLPNMLFEFLHKLIAEANQHYERLPTPPKMLELR
jgi:hypothetical protein